MHTRQSLCQVSKVGNPWRYGRGRLGEEQKWKIVIGNGGGVDTKSYFSSSSSSFSSFPFPKVLSDASGGGRTREHRRWWHRGREAVGELDHGNVGRTSLAPREAERSMYRRFARERGRGTTWVTSFMNVSTPLNFFSLIRLCFRKRCV